MNLEIICISHLLIQINDVNGTGWGYFLLTSPAGMRASCQPLPYPHYLKNLETNKFYCDTEYMKNKSKNVKIPFPADRLELAGRRYII